MNEITIDLSGLDQDGLSQLSLLLDKQLNDYPNDVNEDALEVVNLYIL